MDHTLFSITEIQRSREYEWLRLLTELRRLTGLEISARRDGPWSLRTEAVDANTATSGTDEAIEHVLELLAPFVTPHPRDEACDRVNCRHGHRIHCVQEKGSVEISEQTQ